MKKKTKQIIYIMVIGISFISLVIFSYSKYLSSKVSLKNEPIKVGNSMISLMLETKLHSGEYKESSSSTWPGNGYIFNSVLSNCENGSILTYNEENNTVSVKVNKSDKCYVYFDVEPPDVYVATSNIPTTYGKVGSVDCSSNNATYNQLYNRIEISSINTKYESCTLNYTERTSKTYLNDYVTSLVGTTQGTGEVVSENGYRYEGKNPNNYIWFNNELWRIIGVFDSASHGQSGKNLVKIIRNDSIGALAWDNNDLHGVNNWTTSILNSLLNGAYYNAEDGTNTEYCYGYYTAVKSNCDYRKIGIQDGYRSMISNVTWYLGGYSDNSITAEAFYGYERGTIVYSGRPTSTTGYIGLMYPSDYGYSALSSSCERTINLLSYGWSSCVRQSWLSGSGNEWTLTPSTSYSYDVFILGSSGSLHSVSAQYGYAARPVLYLDSLVYYVDGNGSMLDPIIIGM